jgi:hypothetical protein
MSSTYYSNKEDLNDEVQYGPTDTEDTNTSITGIDKSQSRKQSEAESDTTPLQPKKKVFISECLGQSKSTEDDTDAYTSSSTTEKHWRKKFKPQVSHQPITSALRKSDYTLYKPKN